MRKEIEVKVRVQDSEALLKALAQAGIILSESILQTDETFVGSDYGPYDQFQPGKNILRIRESNGTFLFTLKQPQSNELDCIERETEIQNPSELREALLLMGYQPMVRVVKTRRKASHGGYELCLDEVQGLGTFLEVEKISEDGDAEKIQREIMRFLEQLGIKNAERETHGYDTLLYIQSKAR